MSDTATNGCAIETDLGGGHEPERDSCTLACDNLRHRNAHQHRPRRTSTQPTPHLSPKNTQHTTPRNTTQKAHHCQPLSTHTTKPPLALLPHTFSHDRERGFLPSCRRPRSRTHTESRPTSAPDCADPWPEGSRGAWLRAASERSARRVPPPARSPPGTSPPCPQRNPDPDSASERAKQKQKKGPQDTLFAGED
eukprot:867800-Rhodomonas_salina.3